jgi:hypothetical protein
MVTLMKVPGPWGQSSSACFLLAAIFADILIIRIFLFSAYAFLLTQGCLGYPNWPQYTSTGKIEVSTIVWSCLNLIVHGSAIFRLLYDERPIKFKDEDEKQMRAFFARRGGMGKMEVKEVLKKGRFRRVKKGETILDKLQSVDHLGLLIEGKAHLVSKSKDGFVKTAPVYSGMTFDIGLFNVFGVYIGFEKSGTMFEVVADSDCLVFEWTLYALDDLASRCGPSVSNYFRNFVLFQVAAEWEFRTNAEIRGLTAHTSRGEREPMGFLDGNRSIDFTEPLQDWEVRKPSFKGILLWLWRSLEPFMPPGTRHMALPVSGASGKMRTLMIENVRKEVLSEAYSTAREQSGLKKRASKAKEDDTETFAEV